MKLSNHINGTNVPPAKAAYLSVVAPATGKEWARCPDSTAEDIAAAVAAAKTAFPAWRATPPEERARVLLKVADLLRAHHEELAHLESDDCGKPLAAATEVDIARSIRNFEFFAAAATQFASEAHPTPSALHYTLRDPLGVVAAIAPWNLPLYLLTWKVAPALAAGNTVVAKPSEITPVTAARLAELATEAGLPPGVFNIVHGRGQTAGEALVTHDDVAAVTFTGGTATGARIASLVAPRFKKMSLELGGKNAALVFADARFDETVDTLVRAAFSNQGQICLCASRVYVEESVYPRFREAFVAKARALRVGDPRDATTRCGALISHAHMEKVAGFIAEARSLGGRILCGGEPVKVSGRCEGGSFFAPTIIEGLAASCRVEQEEIFGPVVTLAPFRTEDEAIRLANGTRYGLSATVFTESLHRAQRVARKLHAGLVWVNTWMDRDLRTPFGGVKQSGVGREGGWEALRFFTEPKNVTIPYRED